MNKATLIRRMRYRFRTAISHVPAVYLPLADMRRRDADGATIVTSSTDLVVEAFPRSGNTFTVAALRLCEDGRLELAHHTHSSAQLIRGVRMKRPSLLIVRKPKDAVLSFVMRHPELSIELGLASWIRFHSKLLPYLHGMVVASFEQVTTDLGPVIDSVNARFGTALPRFEHTPENVDACFQAIEARYRMRFGAGEVDESGVARPSSEREERKLQMQADWNSSVLDERRRRATALYDRIRGLALPAGTTMPMTPTPETSAAPDGARR